MPNPYYRRSNSIMNDYIRRKYRSMYRGRINFQDRDGYWINVYVVPDDHHGWWVDGWWDLNNYLMNYHGYKRRYGDY